MPKLLLIFRDICRLKRGPQDLPYAPHLLGLLLVLDLALDIGFAAVQGRAGDVAWRSLGGTVLSLGLLYTLLQTRGFASRFVQTATAAIGTGVLATLLALPLLLAIGEPPATPQQLTGMQVLLTWMLLALLVWKLLIDASILRHALELPLPATVLIALVWILVVRLLFAAGGGSGAPA